MVDTKELAAALVAACEERQIIDVDVREAMLTVPRAQFAPDQIWVGDQLDQLIDKSRDLDAWHTAVYSNEPLVTQHDDGTGTGTMVPSSSLSAPSIVYRMLYDAAINDTDKVFEAGTGSGWTSALMASWVEARNITTMEYDPAVAAIAQKNLTNAGYSYDVIVGDASFGCAERAPYDRFIWTCAVNRLPFPSVEQQSGWEAQYRRRPRYRCRRSRPLLAK